MHTVPIHELLNRIRWDGKFARGHFELGYFDRVEQRIILVRFADVNFPQDDPRASRLADGDGRIHRVPLHRIRELYKNGQRIWHRPGKTTCQ
jgi:uncharacterized protein (UPF0248 family)